MAEQPALAARDRERGRLGSHGEITGGDELTARRRGQRMHSGDDRLRECLHRVHHLGAHFEQVADVGQLRAGHVAEVVAGGEHRAGGREDDTGGVGAADVAERCRELEHHVECQGVALLGAVEGDGGEGAVVLDEQVLVAHRASLAPQAGCHERATLRP